MGNGKYTKDIENLFKKSPVVAASSIERVVHGKKYAKQLTRNLILQGKIMKISKGHYTVYNEPSLIVFCLKPAYLGLQDALSFHNLWEQETVPVVITAAKVRQGIRKVLGANVMVRRIDKKYFFGYDFYEYDNNFYFPHSDIEKTLIDLVYFNQTINKETMEEIIKKINMKKLKSYIQKYPEKTRGRFKNYLKI